MKSLYRERRGKRYGPGPKFSHRSERALSADGYLEAHAAFVQKLAQEKLPDGFQYSMGIVDREVFLEFKGPRFEQFTIVTSGEIVKFYYADAHRALASSGYGTDDLREFLGEAVDGLVELILSGQPLETGKTRVLKRDYIKVQLANFDLVFSQVKTARHTNASREV